MKKHTNMPRISSRLVVAFLLAFCVMPVLVFAAANRRCAWEGVPGTTIRPEAGNDLFLCYNNTDNTDCTPTTSGQNCEISKQRKNCFDGVEECSSANCKGEQWKTLHCVFSLGNGESVAACICN